MMPLALSSRNTSLSVDVAILTVLPEEFEAVRQRLVNCRSDPGSADSPNIFGWKFGEIPYKKTQTTYRVILALTGQAGNISSALATYETLQHWRPRYVFFVGIAGGFELDGLSKGDIVISEVIWGYEYGKIKESFNPRHDLTYRCDIGLLSGAQTFASEHKWMRQIKQKRPGNGSAALTKVLSGPVASGDKVVDNPDQEFFAMVRKAWPKLLAVEMEGVGAAAAIHQIQSKGIVTGFLMIRGISDIPRPEIEVTIGPQLSERDEWKMYAADAAAAFTVSYIRNGLPIPPLEKTIITTPSSPSSAEQNSSHHEPIESGYSSSFASGQEETFASTQSSISSPKQQLSSEFIPTLSENKSGLPSDLLERLRRVLLECDQFESDQRLRAVFIDESINFWRHALPEASSLNSRVNITLDFLFKKYDDRRTPRNALVLFLHVLSGLIDDKDDRHEKLIALADELERVIEILSKDNSQGKGPPKLVILPELTLGDLDRSDTPIIIASKEKSFEQIVEEFSTSRESLENAERIAIEQLRQLDLNSYKVHKPASTIDGGIFPQVLLFPDISIELAEPYLSGVPNSALLVRKRSMKGTL